MKHYYLVRSLSVLGFGLAVGVCALASPASEAAELARESRSIRVSYTDIDMADERGIASIYRRLDSTARRVCGSHDIRDFARHADWRRCYREALDQAVKDVGAQRVARLHHDRLGGDGLTATLVAQHSHSPDCKED